LYTPPLPQAPVAVPERHEGEAGDQREQTFHSARTDFLAVDQVARLVVGDFFLNPPAGSRDADLVEELAHVTHGSSQAILQAMRRLFQRRAAARRVHYDHVEPLVAESFRVPCVELARVLQESAVAVERPAARLRVR
jgi:hypothetical protein